MVRPPINRLWKMNWRLALLGIFTFWAIVSKAQYPQYFHYDTENGLPNSKIYSVLQDQDGFIWFGGDAGLFKFDGIRYIPFAAPTRKSNAITGLTLSASGKLYCYNFRSQLFYLDKNSLMELSHSYKTFYNITADKKGNIFIAHEAGIAQYNEQSGNWTDYAGYSPDLVVKLAPHNSGDEVTFVASSGLGTILDGQLSMDSISQFLPTGTFLMENYGDQPFILSNLQDQVFTIKDGKLYDLRNSHLYEVLKNRKITQVVTLPDQFLWITTYQGIVRYDPKTDHATLFFPNMAFSDCLIDREGNYWFSTLHAGLLRVVDLTNHVWNKENALITNPNITSVIGDSSHIYFATADGTIGMLNAETQALITYHTGNIADVQSLDLIPSEGRLYFNINELFYLENGQIRKWKHSLSAIKSVKKIREDYFFLTSGGVYIQGESEYKIDDGWARELVIDSVQNQVWIATNRGILRCALVDGKWKVMQSLLPEIQVLSLCQNPATKILYALTFDGKIYTIQADQQALHTQIPAKVLPTQIRFHQDQIFISSNHGIWIYDLGAGVWSSQHALDGLASDNVYGIFIQYESLWLATSGGLQQFPIQTKPSKPLARIFLRDLQPEYNLSYGQILVLQPTAAHYASNGQFSFAYRINRSEWIELPGSVTEIQIPNLPAGRFEVEVKAIDHWGRDAENTVLVKGFVNPPFWQKWWFIAIILLLVGAAVYLIVRKYVAGIRKREEQRTLLVTSQLTALKAQMNPHFIFNVLNSIKSYIYENDKEKATEYLDDFADLVRRTLEMSETQSHDISEEIKLLKLYIELEAMMLSGDFSYSIQDEGVLENQFRIPTMILQPYIENAFKHGLRHKSGHKKLTILLKKISGSEYQVHILDNGIGRKESGILNANNPHKKTSFATGAIEKRLALIHSNGHQTITSTIADLQEADGSAAGTHIILSIHNNQSDESDHH